MSERKKRYTFKSGFERMVADQLTSKGVKFEYESLTLPYIRPQTYTPDFILDNGVVIETKGEFTSVDRTKHLIIKEVYPDIDIRFVFQKDNPLRKGSKTRYSDWCIKHGIKWALEEVPEEWLKEKRKK